MVILSRNKVGLDGLSCPQLAVQPAVVDRLADVRRLDVALAVEVGDGAGHAQDLVVARGPRGPAPSSRSCSRFWPSSSSAQNLRSWRLVMRPLSRWLSVPKRCRCTCARPAAPARASLALDVPSAVGRQLPERHRRHLDVDVDAVEQRAADPAHVALDLRRRAVAGVPRVAEVAARARVHRRDQHEAGRERGRVQGPGDRHACRPPAAGAAPPGCGG